LEHGTRRRQTEDDAAKPNRQENRLMTGTILIAASDPNIVYLLQRYAEESGFHTVKVGQGHEVADLAQQIQPALILLELDSPGTAGCQLLHQLHHRQTTCDIPVVVYSYMDEDSGEPLEGAVGHLHKSILYDDFLAALRQAGVTS
jgi:CheY-like chemotaxis protein